MLFIFSPYDVNILSKHLHKSIAELMWWSNQFHLHGDQFKSNKSLDQITTELKEAIAVGITDFFKKQESIHYIIYS